MATERASAGQQARQQALKRYQMQGDGGGQPQPVPSRGSFLGPEYEMRGGGGGEPMIPPQRDFAPPGVNPIGYNPSRDPRDQLDNERARATAQGDIYEQQYRDEYPAYRGAEDRYGRGADAAYERLLQNPGLNQQEQEGMFGGYGGLDYSTRDRQNQFLNPNEQAEIRGDPFRPLSYFNPDRQFRMAREGTDRQREVLGEGAGRVRDATGSRGLYMDPSFAEGQEGTLGGLESNVRGAIDRNRLSLDPAFRDRYPMTDREVESHGELAGKSAMAPFGAAFHEAERRSAGAGSVPGAIGVMQGRLAREAAASAGDAGARAKLAAMGMQRDQFRTLEDMRLDSERDISGRTVDSEFGLANTRIGTEAERERMRQEAERFRTGQIAGTELDLANMRVGAEARGMDANARAGEFTQGLGTGLLADAERGRSDRAAALATNRQDSERYGSDQQFGRGLTLADRQREGYQFTSGARRQDEAEGRGYLGGSRDWASGRLSDTGSQRLQGRQITGNQSLNAAATREQGDTTRRGQGSWATRNVLPWFQAANQGGNLFA